jgi:hypothetical protein
MNVKLESFEDKFDDEVLIRAGLMYENHKVLGLNEFEKHLWIAKVQDGREFEIEILISPSKIKKFSCDCDEFLSSKSCDHIVAGLYALRAKKRKEKEKKKLVVKTKSLPQKIRTKELLPLVSNEELRIFLQNHLNSDKKLSLSFKARFAQKLELFEGKNKYLQILDELIQPVTHAGSQMRGEKISHFVQLGEEYLAQFGDLMSINLFAESLEILGALIKKTSYVCSYSSVFQDKLARLNEKVHAEWWNYCNTIKVPALKSEQVRVSSELAGHSYYNYENPDFDLYQFLFKNSSFIEPSILESLSFKITRNQKAALDCSYLISALFKLVSKIRNPELFLDTQMILRNRPEYISRVLDKYADKGEIDQIVAFIDYTEEHGLSNNIDLSSYKISVHLFQKNRKKAKDLIISEYVQRHNKKVLLKIRLLSASDQKSVYKSIEKQLLVLGRNDELLELYYASGNNEALLSSLINSPTVQSLEKYGYKFWNDFEKEMIQSHISAYTDYLKIHVGFSNSDFIAKKIQKIRRNGWVKAAKKIKEEVYRSYSSRSSLEQVFRKV